MVKCAICGEKPGETPVHHLPGTLAQLGSVGQYAHAACVIARRDRFNKLARKFSLDEDELRARLTGGMMKL